MTDSSNIVAPSGDICASMGCARKKVQRIMVLQQKQNAESKIAGISEYGQGRFLLDVISINETLPPVIDETAEYLPDKIEADLVLDFLNHPDLSCDLADICEEKGIPMIASGHKLKSKWAVTPPT